MPQQQRAIPLICLDVRDRTSIATSNNAAWLCPCGREFPLLGMSCAPAVPADGFKVRCPDCGREYMVNAATTRRTSAVAVRELPSRASSRAS